MPTVEEMLKGLKDTNIQIYFDIKSNGITEPLLQKLLHAVTNQGWDAGRFLLASFDHSDLLEASAFKLAYPELGALRTIVIVDSTPVGLAKGFVDLDVSFISVAEGRVTREYVEDAHNCGLGMMAWTVNSETVMKHFVQLGVDGIVTDKTEICRSIVSQVTQKNGGEPTSQTGIKNVSELPYPEDILPIRKKVNSHLADAQLLLHIIKSSTCLKPLLQSHPKFAMGLEAAVQATLEAAVKYLMPFLKFGLETMVKCDPSSSKSINPVNGLLGFESQWIAHMKRLAPTS
eukprot:CAMPEP_0113937150 /NCGR_PEP_ID=MMETSP1339-20121228/3839_1 /TAXON_ID=94617 /ORGANISM="Fibrocapsa japonica" /LENGTH=287 /DNA_ID=CAMNT_0000939817 /DNA_START=592 /DNA_END=1455 /DNA_ORIENTATION=- /assembly_acc=CAM_ASM_000762